VRIGTTNYLVYRIFQMNAAATVDQLKDTANTQAFFFPIALCGNTTDFTRNVIGKVRQIGFGPNAFRETSLTEATVLKAYGLGYRTAGENPALWFVNADL